MVQYEAVRCNDGAQVSGARTTVNLKPIFAEVAVRHNTPTVKAGLTIRGAHTNFRRGPFSHTRTQNCWCTFLLPKS